MSASIKYTEIGLYSSQKCLHPHLKRGKKTGEKVCTDCERTIYSFRKIRLPLFLRKRK